MYNTKEEAEAAYNEAIEERDKASAKVKEIKRELDTFLEAERAGAVLGVDTSALSAEERKQLVKLLAKAAPPPGSVAVDVNLITQDTEGGKP